MREIVKVMRENMNAESNEKMREMMSAGNSEGLLYLLRLQHKAHGRSQEFY